MRQYFVSILPTNKYVSTTFIKLRSRLSVNNKHHEY